MQRMFKNQCRPFSFEDTIGDFGHLQHTRNGGMDAFEIVVFSSWEIKSLRSLYFKMCFLAVRVD